MSTVDYQPCDEQITPSKYDQIIDKAVEEMGTESIMYILLWGVVGFGVGCLIGYKTKLAI